MAYYPTYLSRDTNGTIVVRLPSLSHFALANTMSAVPEKAQAIAELHVGGLPVHPRNLDELPDRDIYAGGWWLWLYLEINASPSVKGKRAKASSK
jgi:hypothetical protein